VNRKTSIRASLARLLRGEPQLNTSRSSLPIARECAKGDGDLSVIYMGNNEMMGPLDLESSDT
jgi:hypothetical protein